MKGFVYCDFYLKNFRLGLQSKSHLNVFSEKTITLKRRNHSTEAREAIAQKIPILCASDRCYISFVVCSMARTHCCTTASCNSNFAAALHHAILTFCLDCIIHECSVVCTCNANFITLFLECIIHVVCIALCNSKFFCGLHHANSNLIFELHHS